MAGVTSSYQSLMATSRRWLRLTLACALVGLTLTAQADTETEQRARLQALKESIESLRGELSDVKSDRDQLLNALENSEKSISDLSTKVEKLKQQLQQQEQKIDGLQQRKDQLEQDKGAQQGHVGEHINAAFRLGQQSNLRLLLNQQDPALVARNLKYFEYLTQARAVKIKQYLTTIAELQRVEQAIAVNTEQLRHNHNQLREQRDMLVDQRAERQSTLKKLEATIASKDERLRLMQRDRQRLEQVLQRVTQLLDDIKIPADTANFAALKGRLPWPTQGTIVERFGADRVAGRIRWEGMVIKADAGTPVKAVHHGRVVFSDYLRGHGLLLIVDHGTGFMSLYARNQALYKEIGEWVNAGEVIATVGNSGGQASAGLYFELRHNGQPTDPHKWIKTT